MFFNRAAGINWHDRGDRGWLDFEVEELIKDGAFHDLDISGIVGKGQKLVLIRCGLQEPVGGKYGQFITKGYAGDYNAAFIMTQVAGRVSNHDIWITTNVNGIIQYAFVTATWTMINLTIRGWFE